jgi:hypothetical protein
MVGGKMFFLLAMIMFAQSYPALSVGAGTETNGDVVILTAPKLPTLRVVDEAGKTIMECDFVYDQSSLLQNCRLENDSDLNRAMSVIVKSMHTMAEPTRVICEESKPAPKKRRVK